MCFKKTKPICAPLLLTLAVSIIAFSSSSCLESLADRRGSAESTAVRIIESRDCGRCHTLQAEGLQLIGSIGPDLTHQASRGRSDAWLARHLTNPQSIPDSEVVAGFEGKQKLMPPLDDLRAEELKALVGFLQKLH